MTTAAAQRRAVNEDESDCTGSDDYLAVEQAAIQLLRPWRRRVQTLVGDIRSYLRVPLRYAVGDLRALTSNDPASHGEWQHVLTAYVTFQAVLAYRIAHGIHGLPAAGARTVARCISERAKVDTGVEIHPAARIGPRLVIDHGMGTVIGETSVLGADCYLLQGVVLGATGIAGNLGTKRHPTLGDRVQVGGFARILGPVTVGDDVVVGCHTLIRHDVPAGCRVTTLHQYQVTSGAGGLSLDDLDVLGPGRLRLRGANLDAPGLVVELLSRDHESLDQVTVTVLRREPGQLVVAVDPPLAAECGAGYLRLTEPSGSSIAVSVPFARAGRPVRVRPDGRPDSPPDAPQNRGRTRGKTG